MSDRQWWVLRVLPQMELVAEKQVRRLGYLAMAPYREGERYTARRKNSRRWKWPLFPGYLFASWDNWHEGWHRITNEKNPLENISAIYGFLHPIASSMPSLLRASDVDYLLGIADGKYKEEAGSLKKLQVGDRVLIPDGALQGYEGTASEISGENVTVEVRREKNTLKIKTKLAKIEKV